MSARKIPTLQDVANRLGVSAMTVSRAYRNHPNVSDEMRLRIMTVVSEMGYSPNEAARRLSTNNDRRLCLLCESGSNAPNGSVLLAYAKAAQAAKVDLSFETLDCANTSHRRVGDIAKSSDGVLVHAPTSPEDWVRDIEIEHTSQAPVVLVAAESEHRDTTTIGIDQMQSAFDLTSQLIAMGHRKLGVIAGPNQCSNSIARLEGVKRAVSKMGVLLSLDCVQSSDYSFMGGSNAASRLLSGNNRPSALIIFDERQALGAASTATDIGLSVPTDLSLVCWDNSGRLQALSPDIATVSSPIEDMASFAVRELVERIESKAHNRRRVVFPYSIEHRSTLRSLWINEQVRNRPSTQQKHSDHLSPFDLSRMTA